MRNISSLILAAILLASLPAYGFVHGGIGTGAIASSPPAIDGSVSSTTPGGSTVTLSLTTTQPNDVIVVFTVCGSSGDATSISDTAGLTWTKRTATANFGGSTSGEWYAVSTGVLTADTITVNYSAAGGGRTEAFGVSGANTSAPFDSNASFPAKTGSGSSVTTLSTGALTTNHANDLLIGNLSTPSAFGTLTRPTSFTAFQAFGANDSSSLGVTTIQSAQTYTYSWTSAQTNSRLILDAIQAP